jgi:Fe-S-cluster containining protein
MTQTRQQRRSLHREYAKLGRAAFASGFTPQPRREVVLGVALVLKGKLLERDNSRRAGEAAGMAHALVEKSLQARPPKLDIACRQGCTYCCHSYVGVVPPEVFRLAAAIRKSSAPALAIEEVRARCRPLMGLEPMDRLGRKLPCPLLIEGSCAVYADRPMVCRQTTSLSLEACIDEFENRNAHAQIPVSPLHLAHSSNVHVALLGALAAAGRSIAAYELSAALDLVLTTPDAEPRWLAGDDVFASLSPVARTSPDVERVAHRIAEEISV